MGTVQEHVADVNSPIENNANECGVHAHTRASYRFEPYHIGPTILTREDSSSLNPNYTGVLPDHLCTGWHVVNLYVGYVARLTPTDPFLKI